MSRDLRGGVFGAGLYWIVRVAQELPDDRVWQQPAWAFLACLAVLVLAIALRIKAAP